MERVSVLIPCYNEELAIGKVVADFKRSLPEATVYVYDNNSSDRTTEVAMRAGAIVRREPLQGKGNVVRRMFADIDSDLYVLVDGDATYCADSAPAMIFELKQSNSDMLVGVREATDSAAYRPGHKIGNRLLTGTVARLFGRATGDMLSGYRVFSRRFVKSFPALSRGFEIETELTVHALSLRMPVADFKTPYGARPEGSVSKLSTYRDGARIALVILRLLRNERPLLFFSSIGILLLIAGLALGLPVVTEYLRSGLVPRLPTAVLAAALEILAFGSFACGLVLDTVTLARREAARLCYLSYEAPSGACLGGKPTLDARNCEGVTAATLAEIGP